MDFAEKKSDGKARQNLFNRGKKGFVNKSGERGGGGGMSRDTRPNSEGGDGPRREQGGARGSALEVLALAQTGAPT